MNDWSLHLCFLHYSLYGRCRPDCDTGPGVVRRAALPLIQRRRSDGESMSSVHGIRSDPIGEWMRTPDALGVGRGPEHPAAPAPARRHRRRPDAERSLGVAAGAAVAAHQRLVPATVPSLLLRLATRSPQARSSPARARPRIIVSPCTSSATVPLPKKDEGIYRHTPRDFLRKQAPQASRRHALGPAVIPARGGDDDGRSPAPDPGVGRGAAGVGPDPAGPRVGARRTRRRDDGAAARHRGATGQ
jgi:hypothetical protein